MSSLHESHRRPGDHGDGDAAVIFTPSGPSRSEITGELLDAADASLRGQPPCEEERHVGATAEPASAQPLQEQGPSLTATSSSSLHAEAVAQDTTEASPTSTNSCTGSTFWAWLRQDWGLKFFIRVDLEGSFHTYPHVGGPFQSLQEAEDAIDRHLQSRCVQKMCKQAGVSQVEMAIRTILYWPDGTRKKCSQAHAIEKCREERRLFAQVLVDNYNKDHNLGDTAYELKDIVHYQLIVDKYQKLYYHFNFIAKTKKGADDCGVDNLFFAEVKSMREGEHEELVVSCFCMVKPEDNGHCYGCMVDDIVGMKHPNEASAFIGGHLDNHMRLTRSFREWSDEDEEVEEARIRRMYKGHEKPGFVKKLLSKLPPDVRRRCMKRKRKSSEKKVPE